MMDDEIVLVSCNRELIYRNICEDQQRGCKIEIPDAGNMERYIIGISLKYHSSAYILFMLRFVFHMSLHHSNMHLINLSFNQSSFQRRM